MGFSGCFEIKKQKAEGKNTLVKTFAF